MGGYVTEYETFDYAFSFWIALLLCVIGWTLYLFAQMRIAELKKEIKAIKEREDSMQNQIDAINEKLKYYGK